MHRYVTVLTAERTICPVRTIYVVYLRGTTTNEKKFIESPSFNILSRFVPRELQKAHAVVMFIAVPKDGWKRTRRAGQFVKEKEGDKPWKLRTAGAIALADISFVNALSLFLSFIFSSARRRASRSLSQYFFPDDTKQRHSRAAWACFMIPRIYLVPHFNAHAKILRLDSARYVRISKATQLVKFETFRSRNRLSLSTSCFTIANDSGINRREFPFARYTFILFFSLYISS